MALRALVGKLRRDAASRVLTTCEHCGKPSSRIKGSLGRKDGAVKIDPSEELRRDKWRQYKIRTVAAVTSLSISWFFVSVANDFLEDVSRMK